MFNKITLSAALVLASCFTPSQSIAAEKADNPVAAYPVSAFPLYFVTDRVPEVKHGSTTFTNERAGSLSFGKFLPGADRTKFDASKMQLFACEKEFLKELRSTSKIAVFVHGYRKSFPSSIDFGLKMAEHMDRPLLVFAWPSKNSYFAYMKDECTAEWSAHQLAGVLGDMGDTIGYRNIVLVSHSLGSRMIQWALRDLDSERRPNEKFAASLFFSPDVDRDTFIHNSSLLKRTCSDSLLFMGTADTRIRLSRLLHGSPRLGTPVYDQTQADLFKNFTCETFLRNHQIPFDLVSESLRKLSLNSVDDQPVKLDGTKITAGTPPLQSQP